MYRGYYYDFRSHNNTDGFQGSLGLYFLGSRYYDPNIGRFISPDDVSYLGANGDLNAYNLYAYCSNNPVMYSDPSGHSILAAIIIGAVVGGLLGFAPSTVKPFYRGAFRSLWDWCKKGYSLCN